MTNKDKGNEDIRGIKRNCIKKKRKRTGNKNRGGSREDWEREKKERIEDKLKIIEESN